MHVTPTLATVRGGISVTYPSPTFDAQAVIAEMEEKLSGCIEGKLPGLTSLRVEAAKLTARRDELQGRVVSLEAEQRQLNLAAPGKNVAEQVTKVAVQRRQVATDLTDTETTLQALREALASAVANSSPDVIRALDTEQLAIGAAAEKRKAEAVAKVAKALPTEVLKEWLEATVALDYLGNCRDRIESRLLHA